MRNGTDAKLSIGSAIAALLLASATSAPAAAQDAAADAPAGQLEEIIVSARKRAENLQETPIAVAAFSATALEQRAVQNITDVARFVPGVSFDAASNLGGSSAAITAFIRGVGQTDFVPTVDPGVGIYLDGVYIGRTVGSLLDTADIQSIEVLRGPQGALFGKNTIGGAVVVTSRRPGQEFGTEAEVSVGKFGRFDARIASDLPISPTLAMRANVAYESRGGYVGRALDGGHMGNKDSLSGRIRLVASPSESLELDLAIDGTRRREQALPLSLLDVDELGVFAFFNNQFTFGDQCLPPADLGNPNCYTRRWVSPDGRTNYSNEPNRSDLDLWGTSLTAKWAVDSFEFKSITAYRTFDSSFFWDGDASPLVISQSDDEYDQSQFSQEFQLSGTNESRRLKWLLGLYYMRESANNVNDVRFSFASLRSGGRIRNRSMAAFGQATWSFAERWNLTLGARYTDESKRFRPDQVVTRVDPLAALDFGFAGDPANPTCYYFFCNPLTSGSNAPGTPLQVGDRVLPLDAARVSASELTPSVALDFKPVDNVMLYASYSRGFKGGGFTQRLFPPEASASSFKPEKAAVIEGGAKTEWFDRRLRFNVAAFSTRYTDLQVVVNEGIAPKVRNAGKARINGVEIETEMALGRLFTLTASGGYLDASYRRLAANVAGITLDSRLPNAPKWSAAAGLGFEAFASDAGSLNLRVDWSYKSKAFKDAVNSPAIAQNGYSLLSASASFVSGSGRYRLTAGGTNLTNRHVIESGYSNLLFDSYSVATYARPREWFLTLGAKF